MAISQLPQAPYRQDRKVFPTPIIGDVLFSEVRDCTRIEIPEYGTPHPNPKKWPDHKLVFVKTVDIERDGIFEFFYAAERENQDLYNFAFGNRIIGNREFRTVTRTYVTLRENFKPVDIEFGTAMPNVPEDKFKGVNYVFYDKEQQNTQQEELNALFVIEVHSYVEEAVLDEVLTLSTEKPDPLPPKFRVLSPTTTTEELAEGSVETPVLTGDQLAATEDQINTNLKRKRTVSRSSAENISSLSGKIVTNDLQVADVVETIVPDGTTIETSELTVDGSVESLGNGQSVQRVITAPELFPAKSFSIQRLDPLPEKFRILVPTESTEESIAGTAEMPQLTTGELEASEQQVNVHVKRKRKTSRDVTTLPKTLTQKATTNEKQLATVTETLQNGDTVETSSATKDIQSEALGDGTYLVRKVEVPELFSAKSFSVQRLDPLPEKFRILVPTESTEENVVGTAEQPTLATGELEATEQQVNVHVKRKRKTSRDVTTLPKILTQKATTNEKQVATVTETLQNGDTNETATATKDIQSEALGDGTYLVRKVEVPELFTAESYSVQKPDIVPERFRSQVPTTSEQSSKVGQAVMPSLSIGELERSQQQINEFVYREQVTKRNLTNDVSLPEVQQAYVEGTIGKINEKLSSNPNIEKGLLVSESKATPIGDGKFVVQTVKVDKWPTLEGYEWDSVLNASVKRTQQFVPPSGAGAGANVTVQPVNEDRSLRIVEEVPVESLSSYVLSFPVQIDVQLPNVLKKIEIVWSDQYSQGSFSSDWSGAAAGTKSFSLSGSESGSATSSVSLKPELVIDIEQPWGSDVSATSYYFFMRQGETIEGRLNSLGVSGVKRWPMFKPVSHTILLEGASGAVKANVSAAASKGWQNGNGDSWDRTSGKGTEYDIGTSFTTVNIPPTIHGAISISGGSSKERLVTAAANVGWYGYNFPTVFVNSIAQKTVKASVTPDSLPATSPTEIPKSGVYIIKSSIEPYRWGWLKCTAIVLDAADLS